MGSRRTPGLRREEVALLAGVGVSWYTWLEQGRVTASRQVLEAIGRALRLQETSFEYMLLAGGFGKPPANVAEQAHEVEVVRPVIEEWSHGPAFVMNSWFDILAWNQPYLAVWGSPSPPHNLMVDLCTSSHIDALLTGGGDMLARHHLPRFRRQTAPHREISRVDYIYQILEARSPHLHDWWRCQTMDSPPTTSFAVSLPQGVVSMTQLFLDVKDLGVTVVLQRPDDRHSAAIMKQYLQCSPVTSGHRMNLGLTEAS